jgi:predicted metal-dependent HD superfamily phosphohydrolase
MVKEYSFVKDNGSFTGRKDILKRFLSRDRIYIYKFIT